MVQVIHKAIRLIVVPLSKHINESFDVTDAGRLTENARQLIVEEIETELDTNLLNNISSIGDIIVDPEFDANNQAYPSLLQDATLRAIVGLVPKGKTEQIILQIGYQA